MFPGEKGWGGPVAFSPDGKWAVLSERPPLNDRHLVLWDLARGRPAIRLQGKWAGKGKIAFSGDSKRVIGQDTIHSRVRIWEVATGREVKTVPIARTGPFSFSQGGDRAAGCSGKNRLGGFRMRVKVWDLGKARILHEWQDDIIARELREQAREESNNLREKEKRNKE